MMSKEQLENEFNLPFQVIKEIGEARRLSDLHDNGFGSTKIYQKSPISKFDIYKKYNLSFGEGETISWAYIHDDIKGFLND